MRESTGSESIEPGFAVDGGPKNKQHIWGPWVVDGYLRRKSECIGALQNGCEKCDDAYPPSMLLMMCGQVTVRRKKLKRKVKA